MTATNRLNNLPIRPILYQEWLKLAPAKSHDLDFLVPIEAKSLKDVAKITGLSKEYLEQVVKAEDLRNDLYIDSVGRPTIGIGHNIKADPTYNSGNKITTEKVYDLFVKDLKVRLAEQKTLTGGAKLNKGQKQALLDLSFNVGYGNMQDSKLIKMIKAGAVDKAVVEFKDYDLAGGKRNIGLCKRRMGDIYEYSKEKPTELALKTLEYVKNKGEAVFNKKLKTADWAKKRKINADKAMYLAECNQIIDKEKKLLRKNT